MSVLYASAGSSEQGQEEWKMLSTIVGRKDYFGSESTNLEHTVTATHSQPERIPQRPSDKGLICSGAGRSLTLQLPKTASYRFYTLV